jgi:hypothetical protein
MRYLALIYSEEVDPATVSPADWAAVMAAYNQFGRDAGAAGVLLGGEALEPTSTATTIRVRDGERVVTDGPFAETREALGGYYLLECSDLDQAIEWAARIPGASRGGIEVRPIVEFTAEQLEA